VTSYVTVAAGADAALVVAFAGALDATPTVAVATAAGAEALAATTTGVAAHGAGVYAYVWRVPAGTAAGGFVATVAGLLSGVPVSATVVVAVTAGVSYAALADLKEDLRIAAADTTRDSRLIRLLGECSRRIDDHCDRVFWSTATASARVWSTRGRVVRHDDGGELLLVDDIASESGLTVEVGGGSSWAAVTGVETWPDNAIARGRAVCGLVLPAGAWSVYRRVRVTAVWGWPAVPAPVEQACRALTARAYRDMPDAAGAEGEWVPRTGQLSAGMRDLLAKYVRVGIG
jgi:hypothetical protein